MDTKRCLSCDKLSRIDARNCSRCGYVFSQESIRRSGRTTIGSRRLATTTIPSNPPASPHRAGHNSGLHPEDQPYQSSFMPIQRPSVITHRLDEQASDELILPITASSMATRQAPVREREQTPMRYVASPVPTPLPLPQRYSGTLSQRATPVSLPGIEAIPLAPASALHEKNTAPLPVLENLPDKRQTRNRIVSLLLLVSCLSFLLATSILVYLLLDKRTLNSTRAVLIAAPVVLRVNDSFLLSGSSFQPNVAVNLTRDAGIPLNDSVGKPIDMHTNSKGNFAIQILITEHWNIGIHHIFANVNEQASVSTTITVQQAPLAPPKLQLSAKQLDFGTDALGVISTKTITLTNAGGGQINWQAGSDSSWLTILPASGTFSGSAVTNLTVNRANVAAGEHTGYITFIQQGNAYSTLKVTMSVNPYSATATTSVPPSPLTATVGPLPVPAMAITTNTLTFSSIQGSNPPPQTFSITNTGSAPLNWAIIEDTNIASFVFITPTHGSTAPGSSTPISVTPNVAHASGAINGSITISDTDKGTLLQSQRIAVKIIISNQAVISVSTGSMSFNSTSTIEAPARILTITNTGVAQLNWTLSPLPSWLLVDIPGGTLAPSASAFVNVAPDSTGLSAGHTYTYTLVVSDTAPNTPAKAQNVQIILTVT